MIPFNSDNQHYLNFFLINLFLSTHYGSHNNVVL